MKNNRYFRHDWGARNDPKILRIVRVKGAVAKAVYWDLIEMLYEEGGKLPIDAIEDVAFLNHLKDSDVAKYVVFDSGLFSHDDTHFWSERQQRDNTEIKRISEARRDAGKSGGEAKAKQNGSKNVANGEQNGYNKINKINNINNINKINIIDNKDNINNIDNSSSLHSELSPTLPEPEPQPSPVGAKILSRKNCQQVTDFWNSTIDSSGSTLPKVQSLSDARCDKIRIRWGEFARLGDPVEVCRDLFKKAARSKFLQGDNGKGWKASFDWLMTNGKNWVKVIEGNFDDAGPGSAPKSKGERMWENVRKNLEVLPFNEDGTVNI